MNDFGEFTCRNCTATFPKADPAHGASGYCAQCEIALGIVRLHESDANNASEQARARGAVAAYRRALLT